MPCLHRYWLKQFIKFFVIIQVIILVLFVFIDYLSRMDKFLSTDISLAGGLGYVLLKVPFMFVQLTPAGILLASISVFGLMNRNNELLAIRSSGISVYFLIKPAILISIVLAGLMFFLGETVIPVSMARANFIRYTVLKNNNAYLTAQKDIWIKSENRLIHINYYDPVQQQVSGVTISTLGENFVLESRIDAQKGYFIDDQWIFEDIIEQTYQPENKDYTVTMHDQKRFTLSLKPQDLNDVQKKSEEMSFFELRKYVSKVIEEGYDARGYRVDLHAKLAFPFICIIMVLTGSVTGMRRFVRHNMPAAIALGVVLSFFYWVMYGFCLSLGYGAILPPVISAWLANLFFISLAVLYLINTE